MAPAPYGDPAEHLHDLLVVLRLRMRAAARRRQLDDAGGGDALDDEVLAALVGEIARGEGLIAARVAASPAEVTPVHGLAAELFLTPTEVRALVLLVGLELDLAVRDELRRLVGDPRRPHPDVGAIAEIAYATAAERERVPHELGADGTLARFALIDVEPVAAAPFVLRRVRAEARVVELMHGKDVLDRAVARLASLAPPPPAAGLVLDGPALDDATGLVRAAVAASRRGEAAPVVLVTGRAGGGRKALIGAAAAACGLAVLRVRCAALPADVAGLRAVGPALIREAVLWRAMILLEDLDRHPAAGSVALDELLCGAIPVPLAATCAPLTGRPPLTARGAVVIDVGMPGEAAREVLWQRALPDAAPALSRWAAERYFVTPGVIAAAATAAVARAASRPAATAAITRDDVHDGVRGVLDAKLATLGTRITWRQAWSDLVLPDDAVREVRELIARVRHRRQVYEQWGFGRKVAKGLGVSALFAGPPGTGKTMVAGLIADELGLDLYQVDLAKVVSKWVGETEKHLGDLFDAAEAGHVVLLFDEADALFAKRTEVKSSNDRYANLEVNYLLQRMEAFTGIVILTTNLDAAIDDAFRRRLSLKVEFPVPEVDERARLWRALLPPAAAVAADLDLGALAERFEMTGGYIRNAALRAAFLAADEGAPIAMRHLVRAARTEYRSMGKVVAG